MSVYEIANQLVLERASRDEVYSNLFTIMVLYYSNRVSGVYADFHEFARLTSIEPDVFAECNRAAKAEARLTLGAV